MIGVTFAPGSEVWVHGRAAKIVAAADLRSASVEFIPSGERQTLDLAALYAEGVLRWTPPEPEAALAEHGLERITEARWEEARRREAIVKEAFDGPVAFARASLFAMRTMNFAFVSTPKRALTMALSFSRASGVRAQMMVASSSTVWLLMPILRCIGSDSFGTNPISSRARPG